MAEYRSKDSTNIQRSNVMIIVFSGTDGAGKSTQIELLTRYFEAKGRSCISVWARGGYTPLFSAIKSLARLLLGKKIPAQGNNTDREKILKKSSVSTLWLILAIWDLILFYAGYVRIMRFLGKVVICDRYVEDTALDFERNFDNVFNPTGILWRLLLWVTPKPEHCFLLWVPIQISQERSTLKNEPFPDSLETLEYRLEAYLDTNRFPADQYKLIKCTSKIDEISQSIMKSIEGNGV